jgi:DNA-binding NtrC family response regulator
MTGYKLAAQLNLPDLKVLYMSGYSDHTLSPGEKTALGSCFLQKPFALRTLAATISDLLGRSCESEAAVAVAENP